MDPEPAGLGEGWAYLATLKGVSSLWLQNQLQAIPKAVAIEISMYEVFVNNDAENSKGSAKNRKCNQGFRWLTQRVCSQGLMLSPRRRRCTQTSIVHPMLDCGPGCAVFAELRRRSESQVADVFRHRRHEAEYKAGSGPSKSSEEIRIDDKRWRHTFYYSKPNARPRLKIPAQLYLSFFEKSFSDKSNVICQWDQGTVVGRADYRLFPVPRPNRTMEICTRGTGLLSE